MSRPIFRKGALDRRAQRAERPDPPPPVPTARAVRALWVLLAIAIAGLVVIGKTLDHALSERPQSPPPAGSR